MEKNETFRAKSKRDNPTDPFPNVELQNPSYDVPELHIIGLSSYSKALKLWKSWSGMWVHPLLFFVKQLHSFSLLPAAVQQQKISLRFSATDFKSQEKEIHSTIGGN